jgi:hypothetical protein
MVFCLHQILCQLDATKTKCHNVILGCLANVIMAAFLINKLMLNGYGMVFLNKSQYN